jgi:hypothetical protein
MRRESGDGNGGENSCFLGTQDVISSFQGGLPVVLPARGDELSRAGILRLGYRGGWGCKLLRGPFKKFLALDATIASRYRHTPFFGNRLPAVFTLGS